MIFLLSHRVLILFRVNVSCRPDLSERVNSVVPLRMVMDVLANIVSTVVVEVMLVDNIITESIWISITLDTLERWVCAITI